MALGFNPQKTSVESEDFTGAPPPKPFKKRGKNQGKNRSFVMKPMGLTTATGNGLKACKDDDFFDEPIHIH